MCSRKQKRNQTPDILAGCIRLLQLIPPESSKDKNQRLNSESGNSIW